MIWMDSKLSIHGPAITKFDLWILVSSNGNYLDKSLFAITYEAHHSATVTLPYDPYNLLFYLRLSSNNWSFEYILYW